jgi:hypothetical protein
MAEDDALAQAVAGLIFRDMLQPFVGRLDGLDRADRIEAAWSQGGRFRSDDDLTMLDDLAIDEWKPIVVFNGTDVQAGCRMLISNYRLFRTQTGGCLTGATSGGGIPQYPAAYDLTSRIVADGTESCDADVGRARLSVVTAALASARFPYVTPSAAFTTCPEPIEQSSSDSDSPEVEPPDPSTAYVVDGGYADNTGLLTLLQLWEQLEPIVAVQNAGMSERYPDVRVKPWIILVDNHFTSGAAHVEAGRPREVFVPLITALKAGELEEQTLEQRALAEMARQCIGKDDCVPPYVRLAPVVIPGPVAPLGWVLAETSTEQLDESLDAALALLRENRSDLFSVPR